MMKQHIAIKVAGPAGSGIKSIGLMLQKSFQRLGLYTFGYTEYPSLIRGGHNTFQVDVSTQPVNSSTQKIDILLALNPESITLHIDEINKGGVLIADKTIVPTDTSSIKKQNIHLIDLNIKEVLEKNEIPLIMQNSLQLGVIMAICNLGLDSLFEAIDWTFEKKGDDVKNNNKKAASIGYELVEGTSKDIDFTIIPPKSKQEYMVITANEANALGFIAGKGQFYSAYPMTPSTNLLHYLALHGPERGIVVRQASNEIEAVGVAMGASNGGVRAMVGTSGGGMDLMTEFISMLGIAEIPLVIINAQRTGPATGLPTWQEQSDLNMAKYAGHGEYPRIVCAPGDPYEAYIMTQECLNLADIYQIPVIMLTDKHVAESFYTTPIFPQPIAVERGKLITTEEGIKENHFLRYKSDTPNGISPRTVPGMKNGIFLASSDEHSEEGYSTEDGNVRIVQQSKRLKKGDKILKEINNFEYYGDKNADVLIIGWGSTKGAILDSISELNEEQSGTKYGFLQVKYLFPLNHEKLSQIASKHSKIVLVENNSTGQLLPDLKLAGISPHSMILRFDGKPFFKDELTAELSALQLTKNN